jgi:folate-dependent tRNA-U54 methylase TrmFO/GidA
MPELPGVWVAGQVAGAIGYLESLRSGIEVASAVLEDLYTPLADSVRGGHDFCRLEGAG